MSAQTQTAPALSVTPEAAYAKAAQVNAEYAAEIADRRVRELLLLDEIARLQSEVDDLQLELGAAHDAAFEAGVSE